MVFGQLLLPPRRDEDAEGEDASVFTIIIAFILDKMEKRFSSFRYKKKDSRGYSRAR